VSALPRSADRRHRDDGDARLDSLVRAARTGDREAFGALWSLFSPRVAGYLRGRGIEQVDDVTSEVFLAVFTGLHRFSGSAADFRSWLFTIAHHKSVDVHRGRRDVEEYEAEADPRTSASAEDAALASILDPEVRAMLGALTPEQREVLLLRTLGDLSIEQVAEATGRTVGAVKQLHHRAIGTARRVAQLRAVAPAPRRPEISVPLPVTSGTAPTMTET
jgi:RNA polymerase sigma-70 factor (ECF subfamily)